MPHDMDLCHFAQGEASRIPSRIRQGSAGSARIRTILEESPLSAPTHWMTEESRILEVPLHIHAHWCALVHIGDSFYPLLRIWEISIRFG